jgi:hypothetical protein
MVDVKKWLASYWPFMAIIAVTAASVFFIWWLATRPVVPVPPYP